MYIISFIRLMSLQAVKPMLKIGSEVKVDKCYNSMEQQITRALPVSTRSCFIIHTYTFLAAIFW